MTTPCNSMLDLQIEPTELSAGAGETIKNNFEREKEELREEIEAWFALDDETQEKLLVKDELEMKSDAFLHEREYYMKKIYFSKDFDAVEKMDISIQFCETEEENDLWNYLKIMTMSALTSERGWGSIKILVKENTTGTYIGLLQLTYDVYSMSDRDQYIGWTDENKKATVNDQTMIKYLVNISTCIGLQPMAYNMNIGKLLVAIVFSNEVLEYFKKKRGYYYICVVTTSLFGKSIQYDRLPFIKLVGYTKGYGVKQFPVSIDEKILSFYKNFLKKPDHKYSKLHKYQCVFNALKFPRDILNHGQQRGIYIGYISPKSVDFLTEKCSEFGLENIRPLSERVSWWKDRWARNRYERLHSEGKLKIMYEMKYFTNKEKRNEKAKQFLYECYYGEGSEEYRMKKIQYGKDYYQTKKVVIENQHEINQSIKKRTFTIDEIIEMALMKEKRDKKEKLPNGEKITLKSGSQYLSSLFGKKLTGINLHNYWANTNKVYEFEFVDKKITYQQYMEIVGKK